MRCPLRAMYRPSMVYNRQLWRMQAEMKIFNLISVACQIMVSLDTSVWHFRIENHCKWFLTNECCVNYRLGLL